MSAQFGHWHGLAVSDDGVDVLHSHHCPWSIRYIPGAVDTHGHLLATPMHVCEYACDVADEVNHNGFEAFPTEHGFYWFRLEHITHPSGPWGPAEYDMASQWVRIERPRMEVEPATLGEPS